MLAASTVAAVAPTGVTTTLLPSLATVRLALELGKGSAVYGKQCYIARIRRRSC